MRTKILRRVTRRTWDMAFRWLEVLWSCSCNYLNVARYRCYLCGARPPRALRNTVLARVSAYVEHRKSGGLT